MQEEALLEQHDPDPVAVVEEELLPQHEEDAWLFELELELLPQHDDCWVLLEVSSSYQWVGWGRGWTYDIVIGFVSSMGMSK
mgnify:CR=1 FL=1